MRQWTKVLTSCRGGVPSPPRPELGCVLKPSKHTLRAGVEPRLRPNYGRGWNPAPTANNAIYPHHQMSRMPFTTFRAIMAETVAKNIRFTVDSEKALFRRVPISPPRAAAGMT